MIQSCKPKYDKHDRVECKLEKEKTYSVKSLFSKLQEPNSDPTHAKKVTQIIWMKVTPPRTQFTIWQMALG